MAVSHEEFAAVERRLMMGEVSRHGVDARDESVDPPVGVGRLADQDPRR